MQHKIVRKIVMKDCENMNLGRGCMRKIVINHVQTICRLQVNMERHLFPKYRKDRFKKVIRGHQNITALNVALCLVGFRLTVCVTDVTLSAYT